jgi:hypothetical protein
MEIKIRRNFVVVEERREEAGRVANQPLRRVAAFAVVENPFVSRYVEDLACHSCCLTHRRRTRSRSFSVSLAVAG